MYIMLSCVLMFGNCHQLFNRYGNRINECRSTGKYKILEREINFWNFLQNLETYPKCATTLKGNTQCCSHEKAVIVCLCMYNHVCVCVCVCLCVRSVAVKMTRLVCVCVCVCVCVLVCLFRCVGVSRWDTEDRLMIIQTILQDNTNKTMDQPGQFGRQSLR